MWFDFVEVYGDVGSYHQIVVFSHYEGQSVDLLSLGKGKFNLFSRILTQKQDDYAVVRHLQSQT